MSKRLKITRFAVSVDRYDFDGNYGDMTLEEAVEYEKNAHPGEDGWGEYFFESGNLTYASAVEVIEEED